MYIQPKRYYQDKETGDISPLLRDVIRDKVTVDLSFNCGNRRGTWRSSPFIEIETAPPLTSVMWEVEESREVEISDLFDEICASIERNWRTDKFHVVFHSSGWDSRIISSAIKRLVEKNGDEWLGRGLLFLSNRWEAAEAESIIDKQGWGSDHFAGHNYLHHAEHFAPSLDFDKFWHTTNAPVPLPGNLWYYLVEWTQDLNLLPGDEHLQGFSGYWANETWKCSARGGIEDWLEKYSNWYYYNIMATLPQKIPVMEYPLTDVNVLRLIPHTGYGDGDQLRQTVAEFACPEAKGIPRLGLDDRGHKIADWLREDCQKAYAGSWYAKNVRKKWEAPPTSEFSNEWAWWGLASLCEELVRSGVNVRVAGK